MSNLEMLMLGMNILLGFVLIITNLRITLTDQAVAVLIQLMEELLQEKKVSKLYGRDE